MCPPRWEDVQRRRSTNLLRIHRDLSVQKEVTSLKLCTVHGIAVTSIDLEQVKAIQNIKTLVLKIDDHGSFVLSPTFGLAVVLSPKKTAHIRSMSGNAFKGNAVLSHFP